jgi:hypothetical protein
MLITVTHNISDEMIDDLVTTMVECNDMTASWCHHYEADGLHAAKAILSGKDVFFYVDNPEYDDSSSDTRFKPLVKKTLNLSILADGLIRCNKAYPHVLRNLVEGDYDACDADTILQVSLFGEAVYC